jgi:hypothetical protein
MFLVVLLDGLGGFLTQPLGILEKLRMGLVMPFMFITRVDRLWNPTRQGRIFPVSNKFNVLVINNEPVLIGKL